LVGLLGLEVEKTELALHRGALLVVKPYAEALLYRQEYRGKWRGKGSGEATGSQIFKSTGLMKDSPKKDSQTMIQRKNQIKKNHNCYT
jgi:hypothetical protein